jgi:hypothetical protein
MNRLAERALAHEFWQRGFCRANKPDPVLINFVSQFNGGARGSELGENPSETLRRALAHETFSSQRPKL